MKTSLKFVRSAKDIALLVEIDKKTFSATDAFDDVSLWKGSRNYLLYADDVLIGSTALNVNEHWSVFENGDWFVVPSPGSLYITSTAVLPEYQGRGWGRFLKEWQIKYAIKHKLKRIKVTTRESNYRMIKLNKSFGFEIVKLLPNAYEDPVERGVEMELSLP